MDSWQKADKLMTDASSILARWKGLTKSFMVSKTNFSKGLPDLYERGKQQYIEAMKIVENLTIEDTEKFWNAQARNKNVYKFEDLITKKEYNNRAMNNYYNINSSKPSLIRNEINTTEKVKACTRIDDSDDEEEITYVETIKKSKWIPCTTSNAEFVKNRTRIINLYTKKM